MVKQIIKEAIEKNPIGLKESVETELMSRLQLALEAKKKNYKEEDDYKEEDELEESEDFNELDEASSPKWKVKIGNKTYVVTAKNTFDANKKALDAAKKEGNSGVSTGKIEKV